MKPVLVAVIKKEKDRQAFVEFIKEALKDEDDCSNLSMRELTTDLLARGALVGMRLNICDEPLPSTLSSKAILKTLISGVKITARKPYVETFTFKPVAKFIFVTAEAPDISKLDEAMKRRIQVVPFG